MSRCPGMARVVGAAALGFAFLTACEEPGATSGAEVLARDSAGVRIVDHGSLDTTRVALEVGDQPIFRVGWDPDGRLFERVMDAALFDDGRVVVADGGATQELVVLGRDGAVERILGGRGEGPGEFESLAHVEVGRGDTVVAQGELSGRVTVFAEDRVVATASTGTLDNEQLLGWHAGTVFLGPPLGRYMGRLYPDPWRTVPLVTIDAATLATDTVGGADWDQSLDYNGRDPFAAAGQVDEAEGRFVVGRGDRPDLRWYDADGVLLQVARWTDPPEPVSDSLLAAWETYYRSLMEGRLRPNDIDHWVGESLAQHVGTLPYFSQLVADSEGRVFLGEFTRSGYATPGPEGRRYLAFAPTGEGLGVVHLPTRNDFRLVAVGTDRVVGVERDALGVEAVVAYRIVR